MEDYLTYARLFLRTPQERCEDVRLMCEARGWHEIPQLTMQVLWELRA